MNRRNRPGPAQPLARQRAEALLQKANALQEALRFIDAVREYDEAIRLDPGFAFAHNNRANALKKLGRFEEALVGYGRAIACKPDFANAYYNRGNALRDLGRLEQAVADYQSAVAINPASFRVLANLATVLQTLGRFEEALQSHDRAIALNPGDPMLFSNRGNVLAALGRAAEATASFNRALALDPQHAEARYCLSLHLLREGQYEQGWSLYEWRYRVPQLFTPRAFRQPQWRGDFSLAGQTILLHAEQGLGDTLQFCRYVPLVAEQGARIILEVPGSLLPLMRSLCPGVMLLAAGDPLPPFDCHCSLMSLPLAFGTSLEKIPAKGRYLAASDESMGWVASRLQARHQPRVGLVWSGSPQHQEDRWRSIPLRQLDPLLALDLDFHVLQNQMSNDDRAMLKSTGRPVDHADELVDFDRTAALVQHMDLVITVDTSIAHLAGALGKPVWVLLARHSDFRWMRERTDSPWYPSARLFRQSRQGDWGAVIAEVALQLKLRYSLPA